MIRRTLSIAFLVCLGATVFAQEESNLQKFTPAVIFNKGEWDLRLFTSIYSQTALTDQSGNVLMLDHRASFLNSFLEFSIGLRSRINIGAEFHYNRSSIDFNSRSSLHVVLAKDDITYGQAFSYFGPKIRWQPAASLPTLSIQSTFLLPIAQNLETPIFINHDRYNWYTQFFYDHAFSSKISIFTDVGILYRINRNSQGGNLLRFPFALFLNYFPTSKVSFYAFGQYSPRYGTLSNEQMSIFGLTGWFTQLGMGSKLQISQRLGLEISYSKIVWSRNEGAGSNMNFGIRYIH